MTEAAALSARGRVRVRACACVCGRVRACADRGAARALAGLPGPIVCGGQFRVFCICVGAGELRGELCWRLCLCVCVCVARAG